MVCYQGLAHLSQSCSILKVTGDILQYERVLTEASHYVHQENKQVPEISDNRELESIWPFSYSQCF